jgi:hypothetical protein
MIEDIKVRNLSPVTQRCYVHAVAKFAQYFNQSPDRLGLTEARAYQIHLVATGASWAGLGGADCYAEHLAPAIAVDGNRDDHCYRHYTTVLADLHVGRIKPEVLFWSAVQNSL